MRSWIDLARSMTFAAVLACPIVTGAETDLLIATKIENGIYFQTGNLQLDTLKSIGVDALFTYAVFTQTDWAVHVDAMHEKAIDIWGSNPSSFEEGHITERGFINDGLPPV